MKTLNKINYMKMLEKIKPMAISVMGGLFVSTFLTLVVIPSIFMLEHNVRVKIEQFVIKVKQEKSKM